MKNCKLIRHMCIMFEVPTVKTIRGLGFKNLVTPYYDVITSRNDVLRCTTNSTFHLRYYLCTYDVYNSIY